jgi:hypothetical protein
MKGNILILFCVLAVLGRTQTVFDGPRSRPWVGACGNLALLLLPLVAWWAGVGFPTPGIDLVYRVAFSLTVVLLAVGPTWERSWPLPLAWGIFPMLTEPAPVGLWLSLILLEFLLFFAHHEEDPGSNYHKQALGRLLVVFQFFVFDSLFLGQRPLWVAKALAILLCGLYLVSLARVLVRMPRRGPPGWAFLSTYLFYGVMLAERLWGRLPTF